MHDRGVINGISYTCLALLGIILLMFVTNVVLPAHGIWRLAVASFLIMGTW
jgi:hypothetical protein